MEMGRTVIGAFQLIAQKKTLPETFLFLQYNNTPVLVLGTKPVQNKVDLNQDLDIQQMQTALWFNL